MKTLLLATFATVSLALAGCCGDSCKSDKACPSDCTKSCCAAKAPNACPAGCDKPCCAAKATAAPAAPDAKK